MSPLLSVIEHESIIGDEAACVDFRELRYTHDRTTARWPAAPWMLDRAFTKRMHCQCSFPLSTRGLVPSRNSAL